MIQIFLNKAVPEVRGRERLTTGMSGVVFCEFSFSEAWDGLARVAEFSDGVETRTVELTDGVCAVPHEVLTTAGRSVTVGIHGTDGEKTVLPSVYVRLGEVEEGTRGDGDPALALTPSLFEQFLVRAEQAKQAGEIVARYFADGTSAKMRRNLYRGAYLGDRVTVEQLAAIRDGSFDQFFIVDYWTINGVSYRVADMDYWYNVGSPEPLKKHHLVIVPDNNLFDAQMEPSDTTENGYWGSYMKQTALIRARDLLIAAFGSENICKHQEYFVDAAEEGRSTNAIWRQTTIDLMSEIMVFGTNIFSVMNAGGVMNWNYTTARWQLALFRLDPTAIDIPGEKAWLRDIADAKRFTAIGSNGYAYCMKASFANGVRPVFAIG